MQARNQTTTTESTDTTDTGKLPLPEEVRWLVYQHLSFFQQAEARLVSHGFNSSLRAYASHITTPKRVVEYLSNTNGENGQAFLKYYYGTERNIVKPLQDMTPMEVFAYTVTRRQHNPQLAALLGKAMQSHEYHGLSENAKQHLMLSYEALMITSGQTLPPDPTMSGQENNQWPPLTFTRKLIQRDTHHFVNMAGVNLNGADLTKANLSGVYMPNAQLSDATLIETDLTEAYLNQTDLSRSKIQNCKVNQTNLSQIIIRHLNIAGGTDFSQSCMFNIPVSDIDSMIRNLTAQLIPYFPLQNENAVLIGLVTNIKAIASQITDFDDKLYFLDAAIANRVFAKQRGNGLAAEGTALRMLTDLKEQILSDKLDPVDRLWMKK